MAKPAAKPARPDRNELALRANLLRFAGMRDRLEAALPGRMLQECILTIGTGPKASEETRRWANEVMRHLEVARLDTFADLSPQRAAATKPVLADLCHWAMRPYVAEKRPALLVMLAVYFWVEALTTAPEGQEPYLHLYEGTAIHTALSMILDQANDPANADLVAGLERSAEKNGRKLMARMQSLGLYRGA